MTQTARPVTIKTVREQLKATAPVEVPAVDMADRRKLHAKWFSRRDGREREFNGEIRVLGTMDLMRASQAFLRVTGNIPFEIIPNELRNRLWPQAKLTIMLEGQQGSEALIDACDYDRYLLAGVIGEVDRLEAECFHNLLAEGEGPAGDPRVVVTSSRTVAASDLSAPAR